MITVFPQVQVWSYKCHSSEICNSLQINCMARSKTEILIFLQEEMFLLKHFLSYRLHFGQESFATS